MKDAKKSIASVGSELGKLEEQIRRRAYQLYEERGKEDGHEAEDWHRAEEEVRGKERSATAA